jgi:hypothetical protein
MMQIFLIVSPLGFLLILLAEVLFGGPSSAERRKHDEEMQAHLKAIEASRARWNSPEAVEERRVRDAEIARLDEVRRRVHAERWINLD